MVSDKDIVQALMQHGSTPKAAEALHCDARTIRRRKSKPEVQALMQAAMNEAIMENASRLTAGAEKAIATLESIMQDADTATNARIRAAALYLQIGLQYRQCTDLVQQLEALQADFDSVKKNLTDKNGHNMSK